jgi:hypothetical protein
MPRATVTLCAESPNQVEALFLTAWLAEILWFGNNEHPVECEVPGRLSVLTTRQWYHATW